MKRIILYMLLIFLCRCTQKNPVVPETEKADWCSINGDMEPLTVQTIAAYSNAAEYIYIGTYRGVFKSINGGNNWLEKNDGLANFDVTILKVHPLESGIVFCGTWGKGLYMSLDGGEEWQWIWQANQDPRITALCMSPNDKDVLWCGTENGVYRSQNMGQTWIKYLSGRVMSIAYHPTKPQTVFVGIRYQGIYKTVNNGLTWMKLNNGLADESFGKPAPTCICFDPTNPDIIYIETTGWHDIYKTEDGGLNWIMVANILSPFKVFILVVNPENPSDIWAATEKNGIWRSLDGGDTWEEISEGLPTKEIKSLYINTSGHSAVYTGTVGKGLYKFTLK
ncbi:hypothetical protein JW935_13170 [candidate division KSB1 bacterium]|nr:hypothetical protein [candidate division KSB1 bacterium]